MKGVTKFFGLHVLRCSVLNGDWHRRILSVELFSAALMNFFFQMGCESDSVKQACINMTT